MTTASAATDLKKLVSKLQSEREALVKQIEEIDSAFSELGLAPSNTPKRRGRPAKASKAGSATKSKTTKKKGRRKRGSFKISGEQSVLNFVKKTGEVTTAEVNAHWSGEGRGGKADNTLSKLVKDKKLKRINIKGARGSKYKA